VGALRSHLAGKGLDQSGSGSWSFGLDAEVEGADIRGGLIEEEELDLEDGGGLMEEEELDIEDGGGLNEEEELDLEDGGGLNEEEELDLDDGGGLIEEVGIVDFNVVLLGVSSCTLSFLPLEELVMEVSGSEATNTLCSALRVCMTVLRSEVSV
jgi:hypothetical protein